MKGKRLSLTIAKQADELLDSLLVTGLWGKTKAEVAQRLLYQKLQELQQYRDNFERMARP